MIEFVSSLVSNNFFDVKVNHHYPFHSVLELGLFLLGIVYSYTSFAIKFPFCAFILSLDFY